jgi:hypothetical protein
MTQLPVDLSRNSDVLIGCGQSCCLGGIRGGTQGVRSHVGNGRGLARGSGGCGSGGIPHLARGSATDEPATDLLGDIELATSEDSRPGDCFPRAAILWSLRLEQPQHPLGAVRRPRRDDPPVTFAQRLRRAHSEILAGLTTRSAAVAYNGEPGDSLSQGSGGLGRMIETVEFRYRVAAAWCGPAPTRTPRQVYLAIVWGAPTADTGG